MSQTQRVTGVMTDIYTDEKGTHVSYRGTRVVSFNEKEITLRSNGRETATTKTRMNQAASQFRLGFSVFAVKRVWYVAYDGANIPFKDGMTLPRPH